LFHIKCASTVYVASLCVVAVYSGRNKYSGRAAKIAFFSGGHNFRHSCNKELWFFLEILEYTSARNWKTLEIFIIIILGTFIVTLIKLIFLFTKSCNF
jgi:hypothetical protein